MAVKATKTKTPSRISSFGGMLLFVIKRISINFIIKNKIATRLEICDIFGRVVTSENLDYQTSILERKNISDGIYLFKFFNKSKLISTNKIIFK